MQLTREHCYLNETLRQRHAEPDDRVGCRRGSPFDHALDYVLDVIAMTTPTYDEARQAALESLEQGDVQSAFSKFRWTLEYPGQLGEDPQRWRDALSIFARIATDMAGDEFGTLVRRVAASSDDLQTLYDFGYALVEQGLNGIAATALARANSLYPNQEPILTELACALERDVRFHEACRVLREAGEVIEQSFLCRYLLAYNGLVTGDLIEPRNLLRRLDPGDDPNLTFMAGRIREMLTRADAVRGVTPLNETDLRGWHFVLTGGILLHLSPFGFEDAMRGRYAYTQDCAARCLEGIRRLGAVMAAWTGCRAIGKTSAYPSRGNSAESRSCRR